MYIFRFVWVWAILVATYAMTSSREDGLRLHYISGLLNSSRDEPWMAVLRWALWLTVPVALYAPTRAMAGVCAARFLVASWIGAIFSGYDPRAFGHAERNEVLRFLHYGATGVVFLAAVVVFWKGGYRVSAGVWFVASVAYAALFLSNVFVDSLSLASEGFMATEYVLWTHFTLVVALLATREEEEVVKMETPLPVSVPRREAERRRERR